MQQACHEKIDGNHLELSTTVKFLIKGNACTTHAILPQTKHHQSVPPICLNLLFHLVNTILSRKSCCCTQHLLIGITLGFPAIYILSDSNCLKYDVHYS